MAEHAIAEKVQRILQKGYGEILKGTNQDGSQSREDKELKLESHDDRARQICAILKSNVFEQYKNNNQSDLSLIYGKYDDRQHSHLLSPLEWDRSQEEWKLPFGSNFKRPHFIF
eukprot:TCONS_00044407-protein